LPSKLKIFAAKTNFKKEISYDNFMNKILKIINCSRIKNKIYTTNKTRKNTKKKIIVFLFSKKIDKIMKYLLYNKKE